MVFFVALDEEISHTAEIFSYYEALDAAKKGPAGARFQISSFDVEKKNWQRVTDGTVAK